MGENYSNSKNRKLIYLSIFFFVGYILFCSTFVFKTLASNSNALDTIIEDISKTYKVDKEDIGVTINMDKSEFIYNFTLPEDKKLIYASDGNGSYTNVTKDYEELKELVLADSSKYSEYKNVVVNFDNMYVGKNANSSKYYYEKAKLIKSSDDVKVAYVSATLKTDDRIEKVNNLLYVYVNDKLFYSELGDYEELNKVVKKLKIEDKITVMYVDKKSKTEHIFYYLDSEKKVQQYKYNPTKLK